MHINQSTLGVFAVGLLSLLPMACGHDEGAGAEARPYAGQRVMVIAPKLNAGLISGPIIEQAAVFERRTGAEVRVVTPGWNETAEKISESLQGGAEHYDVFVVTTSWCGPLFAADAVAEIPDRIKRAVDWEDILPIYRENLSRWNQGYYALPYDGDVVTLYYRKDLFENPAYRERFRREHGYDLHPPNTWKEYREIAAFFNAWDWDGDGMMEYGLAGNRLVNGSAMLIFLSRAAAYAKHPEDPAYYFDPEDMRPRIDNPGFVQALEEYADALKYGPPGMVNFAGNDVRSAFVRGRAAMAIDWANIGIEAAGSPSSVVRGKVGYAQLPGADRVYDARTRTWEEGPNRASSMVGNYAFLINKDAVNPQAAFDFAAHMTSKAMTGRLAVTSGTGINPSRRSQLDDPGGWQSNGFSRQGAAEYLATLKAALSNPNHIFDIRIPGSARYYAALDRAIHKALIGEASPEDALRQAAAEWETLTDNLGRERQAMLYRSSLGIQ